MPETEKVTSTSTEILQSATSMPILLNDKEGDTLPDNLMQLNGMQDALSVANPENDTPIRHFLPIVEKPNEPKTTCTEIAVQESIDAGIRL